MKAVSDLSQHQKILYRMAKLKDQQEWFLPVDFMKPDMGDTFVGYEASARLTELAKSHPEMMATKPVGRFKARSIKWDDIDRWLYLLPADLRYVFHRCGLTANVRRPREKTNAFAEDMQGKLFDAPAQRRPLL